jgi:hypothetical protein
MLFKEVIAVYSENHTNPTNTKYRITDWYDNWNIQGDQNKTKPKLKKNIEIL